MSNNERNITLKLKASHDEVGNIRTFVFETGGLEWKAGQSQGYVLPQAGDAEAEIQRWFTIASSPNENEIHISTRVSDSNFKQALNALKAGDHIQALGPEGDFTWEEDGDPVILVAGGIGITPFRSILLMRDSSHKPLNATLLYYNRTADVAFESTLAALAEKHPDFNVVFNVGEELSADSILNQAPQALHQIVYLSGPEPMVESVGSELRKLGCTIKQDWFPGYDDKNY